MNTHTHTHTHTHTQTLLRPPMKCDQGTSTDYHKLIPYTDISPHRHLGLANTLTQIQNAHICAVRARDHTEKTMSINSTAHTQRP